MLDINSDQKYPLCDGKFFRVIYLAGRPVSICLLSRYRALPNHRENPRRSLDYSVRGYRSPGAAANFLRVPRKLKIRIRESSEASAGFINFYMHGDSIFRSARWITMEITLKGCRKCKAVEKLVHIKFRIITDASFFVHLILLRRIFLKIYIDRNFILIQDKYFLTPNPIILN